MEKILAAVAALAMFACTTVETKAAITIANATFDSPDVLGPPADNGATYGGATDWTLSGTGGTWDVANYPALQTSTQYWAPGFTFGQVGWLAIGPDSGFSQFSQELGTGLTTNTSYTLSGLVGHPVGFGATHVPATVYRVELWAGTTLLAFTQGTGPEGQMGAFSLTYGTGNTLVSNGLLEIRLQTSTAQTAYDNIQLDATATPEPASIVMWGAMVSVGAALAYRRRGA